jgi:hypothetical protein
MDHAKRGSKHNAITHGIFAKILLTGPGFEDERDDFLKICSDVTNSIRPTNGLERILVEKLAVLFLRLRRVYKEDQAIAHKLFDRVKEILKAGPPPPDLHFISRVDEIITVRQDPPLDLPMRYEANIGREICRTFDQLERLRWLHGADAKPTSQTLEEITGVSQTKKAG